MFLEFCHAQFTFVSSGLTPSPVISSFYFNARGKVGCNHSVSRQCQPEQRKGRNHANLQQILLEPYTRYFNKHVSKSGERLNIGGL